jgi:hypothetical protein
MSPNEIDDRFMIVKKTKIAGGKLENKKLCSLCCRFVGDLLRSFLESNNIRCDDDDSIGPLFSACLELYERFSMIRESCEVLDFFSASLSSVGASLSVKDSRTSVRCAEDVYLFVKGFLTD